MLPIIFLKNKLSPDGCCVLAWGCVPKFQSAFYGEDELVEEEEEAKSGDLKEGAETE